MYIFHEETNTLINMDNITTIRKSRGPESQFEIYFSDPNESYIITEDDSCFKDVLDFFNDVKDDIWGSKAEKRYK